MKQGIINDQCKNQKNLFAAINKFDRHLYKFNFKTSCYLFYA